MKKWRDRLRAFMAAQPKMTSEEATEAALRVYPRCC